MLSLYVDDDGDLWLKDDDQCEATLLGSIEGAVDRVPDELSAEYDRLLDDFRDATRAGLGYLLSVESAYRERVGL